MAQDAQRFDIVIAGGGNAALCAAISAAERGAKVLVCEAAPKGFRGGNSRHTRNLRMAHDAPTAVLTDSYAEEEYFDDLMRVTAGRTNEHLAKLAIRESKHIADWMAARGVRFQRSLGGTLSLSRTNPFFLGGGKALMNTHYLRAAELGVEVRYDTEIVGLEMKDGFCRGLELRARGFKDYVETRAFIAAAGGFQANLEWLEEAWGPAARNFKIRGTPYAKGGLLKLLLAHGAAQIGEPDQCHAVAIDARAPQFDGGIATRLDCVPFAIVVNKHAQRFYDEGEDFWPKRYAIWGRLVAKQPEQIGFAVLDSRAFELFMPSIFPPEVSDTIEGLADKLSLNPAQLRATVDQFNAACAADEDVAPAVHDGRRTSGLSPDKTNWARPIAQPPYYGYPLRPGITFTYLGVGVDEAARVGMADGRPSGNIWAAGEIMAGNILGQGYLAGIGMTIGSVFGRLAGENAAKSLRN
ncbi:MAG: FAD-dependent tricarballylate dehydrogenase TcuA [Neomegalonema sp.]|nr:FAD-dependent tricarballylate dehydrogenase TcuA [Neomegalonema sp.]